MKTFSHSLLLGLMALGLSAQSNFALLSNLTFDSPANDVWGYTAPDGRQYALVGTEDGTAIVDLHDPQNAVILFFYQGANSAWRDLKTWGHHAYVVNETGGGLDIFDLSGLPEEVVKIKWHGTPGHPFSEAHNLWIDEKGYGYLAGGISGGVEIIDLFTDPEKPAWVGYADGPYAHDVHVRDDHMYTFHIYQGRFGVYDVTDRTDPILLATQTTPFQFTHSGWLSDNGLTLFTCDESPGSPTAAFDVSNLSDIRLLDEFKPPYRRDDILIPHNPFVFDDFLFISHYVDGCYLVDAHRPDNLVQIGHFDSLPEKCKGGFRGAWGVYAFPGGSPVLVSDRDHGLFVLHPTYVRACYLEGQVTDAESGGPLFGVRVEIQSENVNKGRSNLSGIFKTGQLTSGTFEVVFQKEGYYEKMLTVDLTAGEVTELQVEMRPLIYPASGKILDTTSGEPIAEVTVLIENNGMEFLDTTDTQGSFEFPSDMEGGFTIHAAKWGWRPVSVFPSENFAGDEVEIKMERGYEDNFEVDMGWTVSGDALRGHWVRGVPMDTLPEPCKKDFTPFRDVEEDSGKKCFVTGNETFYYFSDTGQSNHTFNQVDSGQTVLTSPLMKMEPHFIDPQISYSTWFQNDSTYYQRRSLGYGVYNEVIPQPLTDDSLLVFLDNGRERVLLEALTEPHEWRRSPTFKVRGYLEPTDEMHIIFRTADGLETPNIVEAAIDYFTVTEGFPKDKITEGDEVVKYRLFPNPFHGQATIEYVLTDEREGAKLLVFNVLGQLVEEFSLSGDFGRVQLGETYAVGTYFVVFQVGENFSDALRVVKGW